MQMKMHMPKIAYDPSQIQVFGHDHYMTKMV